MYFFNDGWLRTYIFITIFDSVGVGHGGRGEMAPKIFLGKGEGV